MQPPIPSKSPTKGSRPTPTYPHRSAGQRPPENVVIAQERLTIQAEVLDMLFKWMAERDRIRRKRLAGHPFPWSKDKVLRKHKFCNVYRVYDRGTQYILREVINKGIQTHEEICFRVILFKLFNRISTWHRLDRLLGPLSWARFDLETYGEALANILEFSPIYTSAYQIPAPNLGEAERYMNHLRLLQLMMENDLPGQLLQYEEMRDAYEFIRLYPGMGPFLTYQLLLDLNMSPHLNYPENKWAACGPGSLKCLRMIFGDAVLGLESEAIAYLESTQDEHFARLGITDPPQMYEGRPGLSFVDIEHSLCECSKYYKLRDTKSNWSPRKWKARRSPPTNDLPAKWTAVKLIEPVPAPSIAGDIDSPLTELERDDADEEDVDYEVSCIVGERERSGREYRVRWTGYGRQDEMWLPEAELRNAPEVLKVWRALRRIEGRINQRVKELLHVRKSRLTKRKVSRSTHKRRQATKPR